VSPHGLVAYDGSEWIGPYNPPEALQRIHNGRRVTHGDRDAEFADLRDRTRRDLGMPDPPPAPWPSEVASGLRDRDGNIWLGGARGIWRFEERQGVWKVYPTHGLAESVSGIFEDRFGRIWFADSRAHLAVYEKSKDEWAFYDLAERFPGQDATVETMYIDKQSKVIVSTRPGLLILDEITKEMTPVTVHVGDTRVHKISAITEDNKGRIWMGSYEGIFVLEQ
jgi:hypothetical protein